MDIAEKLMKDGTWKEKRALSLTQEDKDGIFRCIECKARAFPVFPGENSNKVKHYKSNAHKEGCGLAAGGKVFKIAVGVEIRYRDAMKHRDKPIQPPPPPKKGPGKEIDTYHPQDDEEPEDNITVHEDIFAHACGTIFSALSDMRIDDYIETGLKVKDFIVDGRTIETALSEGIEEKKMIVCRRCAVNQLVPNIPRRNGFVILRDAYTNDDSQAIYLYVRFEEPTNDEKFRTEIFGDPVRGLNRDPRKYIVIMGDFKPIKNDYYTIYEVSPLSRARVKFTNHR